EFAQKVITFIVAEVVRHHEAIADESQDDPASTPETDVSTSEAFDN
ncbi:MAG: chorismate mutase, partial [Cutibacterium avidum]|nr:chorismate mutase [Cutibacterium avidum]